MSERTNLASLLRGPASVTPDRPALIDGVRRLTWSELDGAVDHVAGGLREQGLHPGDRVALLLGNSIEFVIGYFAIEANSESVPPSNANWGGAPLLVVYLAISLVTCIAALIVMRVSRRA